VHVAVAVARSSSDGVTTRYVLPVLRMTSFSNMGPMAGITHDVIFFETKNMALRLNQTENSELVIPPYDSVVRKIYDLSVSV